MRAGALSAEAILEIGWCRSRGAGLEEEVII